MLLVDTAREDGLRVGTIQRVPILKGRKARPSSRGGGALDRRAQFHADGARAAEAARLAARTRHPEVRAVRALAVEVARLAAGMDPAAVRAAVERALQRVRNAKPCGGGVSYKVNPISELRGFVYLTRIRWQL